MTRALLQLAVLGASSALQRAFECAQAAGAATAAGHLRQAALEVNRALTFITVKHAQETHS